MVPSLEPAPSPLTETDLDRLHGGRSVIRKLGTTKDTIQPFYRPMPEGSGEVEHF